MRVVAVGGEDHASVAEPVRQFSLAGEGAAGESGQGLADVLLVQLPHRIGPPREDVKFNLHGISPFMRNHCGREMPARSESSRWQAGWLVPLGSTEGHTSVTDRAIPAPRPLRNVVAASCS